MTDVEELLRETLADPRRRLPDAPDLYERVRYGAKRRRQQSLRLGAAASAVVVVVAVAIVVATGPVNPRVARPSTASSASTIEPPADSTSTTIDLGAYNFGTTDVTVTRDAAYVLVGTAPMRLLHIDPTTDKVLGSAYGPSDTNGGLVIDSSRGDLYVWSAGGELREYDARSLAQTSILYDIGLPAGTQIFSAVAIDGQAWFATTEGLFSVVGSGNKGVATKVPGLSGVFGLTADAAHHRVIVGATAATGGDGLGQTQIAAVDVITKKLTLGGRVGVGKEEFVVVGEQVWVGGYNDANKPRLVKLDGATLQPVLEPPLNTLLGPGAIIWPGENVLWVRHGGDETLDCVDSRDGTVLQAWSNVQGPVSSVPGAAYALNNGVLLRLTLNERCPG